MLRLFMIDDGDSISSESVKAPEGIFNKKNSENIKVRRCPPEIRNWNACLHVCKDL